MSKRTKWGLAVVLVVGLGSAVFALSGANKDKATEVRLEAVGQRDLVSAVTASGKIEADAQVDISADITGRIVQLGVKEGDLVKKGQFLVQIDPAQYESAVKRLEGLLASSQASLVQAQTNRDQTKRQLDRWIEMRKINAALVSAEQVEQAQQQYDVALASYNAAAANVDQARGSLSEARDQLSKTRIVSPINGRVVRLPVEVGEVAVPGTFSRETGRLMTIADLGTILAKVKVDETDVVRVHLNDSVEVTIDAFTDSAFTGRVTKISNSATVAASNTGSGDRAVDFDVEVTLDNPPAGIRPDLSATARIVTDTRSKTLSIPIIALTVRQHEELPNELKEGEAAPAKTTSIREKDREGVFVVQGGVATFRAVKVGIAGDEYFEVVDGLKQGDSIVAGPYQAVRDMKDSTRVKPVKDEKGGKKP
ncbi:MAG: efflux RND transporter periplasmic adaptor subunit [Gemmatimonadales bacterium]|nr:efflux RND transporter periplasmic adaptor subunit [Gemmatimonadales bacterium]